MISLHDLIDQQMAFSKPRCAVTLKGHIFKQSYKAIIIHAAAGFTTFQCITVNGKYNIAIDPAFAKSSLEGMGMFNRRMRNKQRNHSQYKRYANNNCMQHNFV